MMSQILPSQSRKLNIMAEENINQIKYTKKIHFNFGFKDIHSQKSGEVSLLNFCDLHLGCSFHLLTLKLTKSRTL